ncbi:RICIN domain-containing protein, partial [Spirosoma utsteinense]
GNTLEGNRRGITLYHNATSEVAVVGNTLTNSGSIDFTPLQQNEGRQQFIPIFNNQIISNTVSNTDRTNGVFIGVHSVQHIQTRTFGTSVIGLEMRGNSLTAGQPNVPAVVDADYPEGYFNYLEYHQMSVYQDERIPAVLGTIFESNRANNCANGLYLNTGSYNTVVCDLQLVNSGGMKDSPLDNISHGAVGTGGCSPITQPVSAPVATVSLNWVTSPAGLQVSINGQVRTTPYSQTFTVGSTVSLAVASPQTVNGVSYTFTGWSGEAGTSLTVPATNTTYTASLATAAGPPAPAIVSGQVYTITVKHSSQLIDARDADGRIGQWAATGGTTQKWVLTDRGNGYYLIRSSLNGKGMDVFNNSTSDGAPVLQWDPSTQDNQQYKLIDAGGGYYNLVARHSQKYLAIAGSSPNEGAWLQQGPGSGGDNQKFRFTAAGPAAPAVVSGQVYTITVKHSSQLIDARDADGRIGQWAATGGTTQKWVLTDRGNGYYLIRSSLNGKGMDVFNNSTSDGAPVLQWTPSTQDNQQYKLIDAGGGYYNLVARHSQKYLAIAGSSPNEGAWLQQGPNSGGDNQKFRFTSQGSGRIATLEAGVERGLEESVVVYPNPAVSVITVTGVQGCQVRLVDMLGQVQTTVMSQQDRCQIDLSTLSPGMYVVQVTKQGQLISRKLIINH